MPAKPIRFFRYFLLSGIAWGELCRNPQCNIPVTCAAYLPLHPPTYQLRLRNSDFVSLSLPPPHIRAHTAPKKFNIFLKVYIICGSHTKNQHLNPKIERFMTIFRLQDIFSKSTVLPVIGHFTMKDFPHACRKNVIKSTVFIKNTWFITHFDPQMPMA